MTRRLELWVQLRELNEAGEFTAVEVLPTKDVRTGGVFQLRQVGFRRRPHSSASEKKGSFRMVVSPACAGPVPPGPGGGAIGPRLGHHAPHRCLHPLRFHRGCQSATGASIQRRIALGELGQIKYRCLFFQ